MWHRVDVRDLPADMLAMIQSGVPYRAWRILRTYLERLTGRHLRHLYVGSQA